MTFPRMSSLRSPDDFRRRLTELGLDLEFDEELISGAPSSLAQGIQRDQGSIGNRFAILPMEGWDGTSDGKPSEPHSSSLVAFWRQRRKTDLGR